ncbi:MAG: N-methyl-D-aspartate receptor NMDAR2C subunit [Patescibacteria group bacterium]
MDNETEEELKRRWTTLCRRFYETYGYQLGAQNIIDRWWKVLDTRYSEPHRAYHTWDHIVACLREFDQVAHLFDYPLAAELALFFHDAIYDPTQKYNEQASAELLDAFCKDLGIANNASSLVKCTDHDPGRLTAMTEDEKLVCAIDLAILGELNMRYVSYAYGIHEEYREVPIDIYRQKRADLLDGFLQRKRIFLPDFFYGKYERQARKNLSWEADALRQGIFPAE